MRSYNNSSTAATNGGFGRWNSPVPYLFAGVALMLCLITVALVILACTGRKSSSSSSSSQRSDSRAAMAIETDNRKQIGKLEAVVDPEQPRIVVIMAGDDKATYLANPAVCSSVDRLDKQAV